MHGMVELPRSAADGYLRCMNGCEDQTVKAIGLRFIEVIGAQDLPEQ